ncbi:MAG: DUF4160 domain-containing protein [Bdellovibrionales bacterium]|nr:DUF4160 domain-containing protein [Bdellovibrionales bacterium]
MRYKNIRVVIYPQDHWPPHIHVLAPGCEAKFTLDPIDCYFCRGFKESFIKATTKYLKEKQNLLLEAWIEYQK